MAKMEREDALRKARIVHMLGVKFQQKQCDLMCLTCPLHIVDSDDNMQCALNIVVQNIGKFAKGETI